MIDRFYSNAVQKWLKKKHVGTLYIINQAVPGRTLTAKVLTRYSGPPVRTVVIQLVD